MYQISEIQIQIISIKDFGAEIGVLFIWSSVNGTVFNGNMCAIY